MATDAIREAMTPGTITTLGALRPGDVGVFVRADGDGEPFVVLDRHPAHEATRIHKVTDHSPYWSDWHGKIVRYLGRGRVEPARIVMEGEEDPVVEWWHETAKLEVQVRTLREALTWMISEESDWENGEVGVGHKFRAKARAALAANAPKEKPCTT